MSQTFLRGWRRPVIRPFLWELRDQETTNRLSWGLTGSGLLRQIAQARAFLASKNLNRGDRVAVLAHNNIEWVAMDLAIMAEGLIVVPLYARQAPAELVAMMKDCSPALICCGDATLARWDCAKLAGGPAAGVVRGCVRRCGFEGGLWNPRLFDTERAAGGAPNGFRSGHNHLHVGHFWRSQRRRFDGGNVGHMLGCTSGRLDALMEGKPGQDRVFHYLPFCFAGSWIMLLTCLLRGSLLTMNSDLGKACK